MATLIKNDAPYVFVSIAVVYAPKPYMPACVTESIPVRPTSKSSERASGMNILDNY